tara:strand:+ start:250 stop:552 length:303 start_codon:yes stop_codon:yes gene_type:complete
MIKKIYFSLFLLVILNQCTTPGSALLSPVITGAKTGSVYQTSLSYGSNKLVNQLTSKKKNNIFKKKLSKIPYIDEDPKILLAYAVEYVEYSEVVEPEPLP